MQEMIPLWRSETSKRSGHAVKTQGLRSRFKPYAHIHAYLHVHSYQVATMFMAHGVPWWWSPIPVAYVAESTDESAADERISQVLSFKRMNELPQHGCTQRGQS